MKVKKFLALINFPSSSKVCSPKGKNRVHLEDQVTHPIQATG